MREIKFRGKAIMSIEELELMGIEHDSGWVYGNLIKNGNRPMITADILEVIEESIYPGWWAIVEPKSVGQYTGLKDIEQFEVPRKLYTGDIVKMHQFLFDGGEYEEEVIGVLEYKDEVAAVCLTKIQQDDIRKYMGYGTKQEEFEKEQIPVCMFYGLHECSWTYLGNIFETPELLKEGVSV